MFMSNILQSTLLLSCTRSLDRVTSHHTKLMTPLSSLSEGTLIILINIHVVILKPCKWRTWFVSLLTSRPQRCSRVVHLRLASGVSYDAGINPRVLSRHLDDAQHKGRAAPLGEFKAIHVFIAYVPKDGAFGVVALSYIPHLGVDGIRVEPEDDVTGDVTTVTLNRLVAEDGRVKDSDRLVQQELAWP